MQPNQPNLSRLPELTRAIEAARLGSQMGVGMALDALTTEGAAGSLTIHIPRKTNDRVEIEFKLRNHHPDF